MSPVICEDDTLGQSSFSSGSTTCWVPTQCLLMFCQILFRTSKVIHCVESIGSIQSDGVYSFWMYITSNIYLRRNH